MSGGPIAADHSPAGTDPAGKSPWWVAARTTGAQASGAHQALGALLDPDSAANQAMLRKLAGRAGRTLTDRVRKEMAAGAAQLRPLQQREVQHDQHADRPAAAAG